MAPKSHHDQGTLTVSRSGQIAMLVRYRPKSVRVQFSDDPPIPDPCEPPPCNEDDVWVDIERVCGDCSDEHLFEVKITWETKTERTVSWEIQG